MARYRGFARDGGFEGQGENRRSVTIFGRTFWQVLCARMAFVVIFEVNNDCKLIKFKLMLHLYLLLFTAFCSHCCGRHCLPHPRRASKCSE